MAVNQGNPRWWQRLIPRHGNWGAPGWSAGRWNSDPALTDWSVPAVDAMDDAFKAHDWLYQHGCDRDRADRGLVHDLRGVRPVTLYGKCYRLLAMTAFSVLPLMRRLGTYSRLYP